MPKQLQTIVRQGRKILANKYLEQILTTRDTCFFFHAPKLTGEAQLSLKQKMHKEKMTWRHIRGSVSRHYLENSPYRELQSILQGPVMMAYPEEVEDMPINTKTILNLAKEYKLGLLGAKWRNTFLTPDDIKELKSEAVLRGEVLSLFLTYHDGVARALNTYVKKQTGEGEEGEKKEEGAKAEGEAAAPAEPPAK